jgi:hypothetical protein
MKHIPTFKSFISESTAQDFIKDVKDNDDILGSGAYEKDGNIVVYLDGRDPNKEKNAINKIVRTKYKDKLKKVNDGSEDSMTFKVLKESFHTADETPIGVNNMHRPVNAIDEATEQFQAVDIPKNAIDKIEYMVNRWGVNQAIRDALGSDKVYQSSVSIDKNNIIISITQKTRK